MILRVYNKGEEWIMDEKELEESIEEKANALIDKNTNTEITSLLDEKAKSSDNVKEVIDLLATRNALSQKETVQKIVNEKDEELRNDAESKRIQAETERVNEEVKKVVAEKEKQIAEYDKLITAKRKEIEELKAKADEEEAYFERNKEILKYLNVRSKKSLKTMQVLMIPSTIVFFVVQILLFPITFCGLIIESIVNILGGVCGSIKNNAFRIIIAILVLTILVGAFVCVYYFGGDLIAKSFN